jgi:peroxiredoxin
MSKRRRQWILWLGGIGLVGVVALAVLVLPWRPSTDTPSIAANPAQRSSGVPVGTDVSEQAPDFTLIDIDGARFSLSDLRGRPVVLYFSASWCLPCAPETQELAQRKARYGNLEIVWVSVDPNTDSPEALRAHRRKYAREDFIYALDTIGLARQYRVVSLGDLYLLDAQGRIVFKGTRPVGTKPFEEALKKAVSY